MFESKVVAKMYLKVKFQTLKMQEGKIMRKHIHKFRSLLEELSLVRAPIVDDWSYALIN